MYNNNHVNHFMPMPNFYLPPPSQPPQPLNSARVFFPPVSQLHPQPFYQQPHAQPHMNPQFFNLSVPPPPIVQNINNLITTNLHHNYPIRPAVNVTHHMTTSDRFSKIYHARSGHNGRPSNRSGQSKLPRNQQIGLNDSDERSAVSTTETLRVELDKNTNDQSLLRLNAEDQPEREDAEESPNSKESGSSENSQESINLVPTDNDSDGEHVEMGRNWRLLMLFNGLVRDEDLAPNCERPQTEDGRTFPGILRKPVSNGEGPQTEYGRTFPGILKKPVLASNGEGQQLEYGRSFPGILKKTFMPSNREPLTEHGRTFPGILKKTTALQNAEEPKGAPQQERHQLSKLPSTSQERVPGGGNVGGLGYATRSSNVWVSNGLLAKMNQPLPQHPSRTPAVISNGYARPDTPNNQQSAVTKNSDSPKSATRKRFHNHSLTILKNGKRLYAGSKDCFQFLETGDCLSGIFCDFLHDGSIEHAAKKVCTSLMRGICRNTDDNCTFGPHSTLKAHQMPVCDFYLRMCCSKGKDQCAYLHVKHTDGMEPCEDFNRGCCKQGVMCISPHRYRYHRIKEKQMERPRQSAADQPKPATELLTDNSHSTSSNDKQNDILLKWFS